VPKIDPVLADVRPFVALAGKAEDPYLGEIRLFAFNYSPSPWAVCDGQKLSIGQNTGLCQLLWTRFGGD
jgi:hypothetical protein